MTKRIIRFGVIGCGLMGKEFASAAARWCHLTDMDVEPQIVAVCDENKQMLEWFEKSIPSITGVYTDYRELLADPMVEAIYCAVPHHLHAQFYVDIIEAGKHLLGEKPFGIDQQANRLIMDALQRNPEVIVRCSSEFPFYPGAYQLVEWVKQNKFGTIIEVEIGFWHSSDLDPNKPINWKRRTQTNGEYGCMGDLGMHVLHLPLRFGWKPQNVTAFLSQIIHERPDADGNMVACDTWDNAVLACKTDYEGQSFPMMLSMKRIAPGHANTWFMRVIGTSFSAEYSTKYPKQISSMTYTSGGNQAWHVSDVPYRSAYPTITGNIFEFGFSDSILQMWAAFCDELIHGEMMQQPLYCATPRESSDSHRLLTAALESQLTGQTIELDWG